MISKRASDRAATLSKTKKLTKSGGFKRKVYISGSTEWTEMGYERFLHQGFIGELVLLDWELFFGMRSEMRVSEFVKFF